MARISSRSDIRELRAEVVWVYPDYVKIATQLGKVYSVPSKTIRLMRPPDEGDAAAGPVPLADLKTLPGRKTKTPPVEDCKIKNRPAKEERKEPCSSISYYYCSSDDAASEQERSEKKDAGKSREDKSRHGHKRVREQGNRADKTQEGARAHQIYKRRRRAKRTSARDLEGERRRKSSRESSRPPREPRLPAWKYLASGIVCNRFAHSADSDSAPDNAVVFTPLSAQIGPLRKSAPICK